MVQFTLICILAVWLTSLAECFERKTAIVIKDFEYNKEGIDVGRLRTFRRLVDSSKIFIDRTKLIKDLLEDDAKLILIIVPRRYGSSVNLLMVHDFLDHSSRTKTINFRLFKYGEYITLRSGIRKLENLLLISHHEEIMDRYQGKYPTVYLHLNDIGGNGLAEILYAFKYRIGDIFRQQIDLRQELLNMANNATVAPDIKQRANVDLQQFNKFATQKANETELINSVDYLCELLYRYHGKRVFLFIDNYDGILNSFYLRLSIPKSQENKVENFFSQFIQKSLRSAHVEKAILTGILLVVKEATFNDLENLKVYTHTDDRIFPYFALSKTEVEELMHDVRIPYDLQQEASDWYNGYRSGKDYSYYNPWSLLKFLSTKVIQNNYEYSRLVQYFIKKFVKCEALKHEIKSLVDGKTVSSVPINELHFGKEAFFNLRTFIGMDPFPFVDRNITMQFFAFLYNVGLVTTDDFPQHAIETGGNVSLRLPNQEVVHELMDELGYLDEFVI